VIGQAILLPGDSYTVIGVLSPGFEYFTPVDVYVPIELFLAPNSGLADRGSSFTLHAFSTFADIPPDNRHQPASIRNPVTHVVCCRTSGKRIEGLDGFGP